ncbi:MAG: beta-ketoacyl-ACP synthase [Magnetococcales bacterium]|nr:beta-ketoacyl-ACP synthase [Magnetococcales bacterium]
MTEPFFLNALGVLTALGSGRDATAAALFTDHLTWEQLCSASATSATSPGAVVSPLPEIPSALAIWNSRTHRLLLAILNQIRPQVEEAIECFGPDRVGVVLGSSTSGIAEGEEAVDQLYHRGSWPSGYDYRQQEAGAPALFLARLLGLTAPAFVVATACSSSAKVFASARRLLRAGLCDAVLVGGVDTLCRFTQAGFGALESLSASPRCNPFSRHRDGIHIGEGGALFLMSRAQAPVALLGVGESSDAYHVSAPDPSGEGARLAMEAALADAAMTPHHISYVNLHGTATRLNDSMESRVVYALFGETPCSSTKALFGHTLGAAGAIEAAVLWLALHPEYNPHRAVPPHIWDGQADDQLAPLHLARPGACFVPGPTTAMLSNSFAFGGSNAAIILGHMP